MNDVKVYIVLFTIFTEFLGYEPTEVKHNEIEISDSFLLTNGISR